MTTDRQFAYGGDVISGAECPAVQAGFPPTDDGNENVLIVAEEYDSIAEELAIERHLFGPNETSIEGVIDEKIAKEAWMKAVQTIHAEEGESGAYKAGRLVAEHLSWR